jgi:hypothetical protein
LAGERGDQRRRGFVDSMHVVDGDRERQLSADAPEPTQKRGAQLVARQLRGEEVAKLRPAGRFGFRSRAGRRVFEQHLGNAFGARR